MAKRKQQEIELEAAMHGIAPKKTSGFQPGQPGQSGPTGLQPPSSGLGHNLGEQLDQALAKGLPVRIGRRKK